MVLDHIAWKYFSTTDAVGFLMHAIGRMTAPIMCLFIAEGFEHTRNKLKYGLRLFIFAAISWIPFNYFELNKLIFLDDAGNFVFPNPLMSYQSVIFTLFISFLTLCIMNSNVHMILKIIGVYLCCFVVYGRADWNVYAIIFTLILWCFRNNNKKRLIAFSIVAILSAVYKIIAAGVDWQTQFYQIGIVLVIPLIYLYNGEKGSSKAFHKWFFYIFYPAHLAVLELIYLYV